MQRFENSITVTHDLDSNSWRFNLPKRGEAIRDWRTFGNDRCTTTIKPDHQDLLLIVNPDPGCMVMIQISYYEDHHTKGLRVVKDGFAAFIFNGKLWEAWRCPHDVRITPMFPRGLDITITGLGGRQLVRVNSEEYYHHLITFEHALDYCAGRRSLADILALVEAEERLRLYKERQMIYKKLLVLIRKFKGAVRSKTAAEIEDLLMELVGEKLPF